MPRWPVSIAVAPGERRGVAGQGDKGDVAAQRGDRGGGIDLVERQHVAVVVAQDVVRGERRLAHGARLREAV